jgi:hypothetical protein
LRTYDAHKYDCARSKHIERIPFLTAKTQRARREQEMNKTKEEIEQIAEQVVDAMLKVHTEHWGPACEVALPVR